MYTETKRPRDLLSLILNTANNTLALCFVVGHYSDENYEEPSSWR